MPRDRLPPIEEADTYYHADLVGLAAVSEDGAALGTVTAIHNFGAGDLIEIAPAGGGEPLLLPFTETTVPKIDLKAGRIVVVPPAEIERRTKTDDVARATTPFIPAQAGIQSDTYALILAPGSPLSRGRAGGRSCGARAC